MSPNEYLNKAKKILESSSETFNELELSVLEDSYNKMSYEKMAVKYKFSESYIRTIGSELFKKLSFIFKEKVGKKNLRQVINNRLTQEDSEFAISVPESKLEGMWQGSVFQSEFRNSNSIKFGIRLELILQMDRVSGKMVLITTSLMKDQAFTRELKKDPYLPDYLTPEIEYKINGSIHHSRFINISYSPIELRTHQFGFIILEDNGYQKHRLKGKFIGYGSISNEIVSGKIILKRS